MHTVLLVAISPLVSLVLLGSAWWIAHRLSGRLREGRLKRILYSRPPLIAVVAVTVLFFLAILWSSGDI